MQNTRPPMLLRKICQSVGLASLILVMNYGDLLGGGADVRMHVPFALGGIVAAQIADVLLLAFVIFLLLVLLQRTRVYNWARLLLAIVIPPFLLGRMQDLLHFILIANWITWFAVLWTGVLLLLRLKFPRSYRKVMEFSGGVAAFTAVFALAAIAQLLWVAHWRPGPQQRVAAWSASPQPPRQHPLLVWVLFDELSYDQAFEHRAHDLSLPNFDALRGQSTLFTDVQPVGYKTAKIVPSLLSGHPVDDFRFKGNNRFLVHDQDQRGWHALDGSGTVFHEAQANGWRTAVVGWYNPYCTIYGDAIDDCYFMNLDRIDGLMSQRDSFWRNTYSPLRQMMREIEAPAKAEREACNYDVHQRYQTQTDLRQHSLQLLHTDQADFVFLHMSIPHSPNIWSRLDDAYTQTCDSSYLDNLALADRMLGEVMRTLQASPRWNDTTLIVQGDHGWRIDLWNWLPAWTDEDDAASRGVFDPRPALLVHRAGQTQPLTNASAWPLIRIHDVVTQVLDGKSPAF